MIDPVGEFKERNPVGWANLRRAIDCRDRIGHRRYHLQADVVDGGEVSKAMETLEQPWNQEAESSRPGGVVDVDSEDLIAYVRDSAF